MITLPAVEAMALLKAHDAGDPDATELLEAAFAVVDVSCFLCSVPMTVAASKRIVAFADPTSRAHVQIWLQCGTCASLPPKERERRELAMARRTWPHTRWWREPKDALPGYMRGSRIKARGKL